MTDKPESGRPPALTTKEWARRVWDALLVGTPSDTNVAVIADVLRQAQAAMRERCAQVAESHIREIACTCAECTEDRKIGIAIRTLEIE